MTANARQYYALGFAAFTVPAILILPKTGWLWAAVFAAAGATALAGLIVLRRRRQKSLVRLAAGSAAGRAALLAVLLWNDLILGRIAAYLCRAYPSGSAFPLVGLLLLLLALYAAQKGGGAILRAGAIVFFFLIGFYLLILGFSLPDLRLSWLKPDLRPIWTAFPAALAPVSVLYLFEGENKEGKPTLWLIGGVLLALLAALVTAGSVSPPVARQEIFPFYTAAKSVKLFGAMERLEPFVSAALTAGGFCLLGTLCAANEKILSVYVPKPTKLAALTNFSVGGACVWASGVVSEGIFAIGMTIFWGLIPLLTLLLGERKKT
ncbi:MAG: LPXTG cell wall anchor domain-containing protein [Oscillospiraceae bacterium]|nr:LPXTG cell wall anchor domain-containing protein [Oscillospiraceae bacterium]